MLVYSTYLLIALQFAPNNDNYAIKFAHDTVLCLLQIYFAICMCIVDFLNGFTLLVQCNLDLVTLLVSTKTVTKSYNLINNPRMFNGAIVDLAEKPYIQQKFLLQWICCKCLSECNRHSYFWPQRSWRLLEAKNTPQRSSFIESFSAPSKTPWRVQLDLSYDLR